ncbi:MAG: hypothetical protein JSR58_08100 [Verrucomicrobia bacterium]|nr:hypothetical protein [Verrucomicrobiota bacterium]
MNTDFFFEITDFLAGLTIQVGNFLKIQKLATGWLFSLIAIGYWIMRAHTTGFYSQTFWHMVSFSVAGFGFLKWRKTSL